MKRPVIAALGAALIATLGASSAAQAAMIDFIVTTLGGTITYSGSSLDQSSALDLDDAMFLVTKAGVGDDASGLKPGDMISLFVDAYPPSELIYGSGDKPSDFPVPLVAEVVKSWTGSTGDMFTETLTTVDEIDRGTPNEITVILSGTLSDTADIFTDAPASLMLVATQFGGPGFDVSATFTDVSHTGAVPEPSTWVMMAFGFGALGYAGSRRRKTNISMLSA
jgi:hypothetical protein